MSEQPRPDEAARLAAIRARCEAATPGPWLIGVVGRDPFTDYSEALAKGVTPDVHVVYVRVANDPEPRYVAITGNGPTSEANADFNAHSREDVPWLLDRIAALTAEVAFEARLNQHHQEERARAEAAERALAACREALAVEEEAEAHMDGCADCWNSDAGCKAYFALRQRAATMRRAALAPPDGAS